MKPGTQLNIARVGISLPCEIPVLPGTPDIDVPLEQRTEKCHVDAWWFVGSVPTCDIHLRTVASIAHFDFDELVDEAGGLNDTEQNTPWEQRHRYPQEEEN